MWVLVVNGLVYLTFIYLHGEWRDLVPRRGDLRDSWEMIKFYSFAESIRMQGKHNALQKGAYFAMPWIGVLIVSSGSRSGSRWSSRRSRTSRRLCVGALLALHGDDRDRRLAVGHVFMVFAVDPYSLPSMITGGYSERFLARGAQRTAVLSSLPAARSVAVIAA